MREKGNESNALATSFVGRLIDCSLLFCRLGIDLCSELAGMTSDVLAGLP